MIVISSEISFVLFNRTGMGVALLARFMSGAGAELCVVGAGWSGILFVYCTMTQVGAQSG